MKVRISTKDNLVYIHDISIKDIGLYLDLLNAHTLLNENGDCSKISSIFIDIYQNIVDISTEEEE